jgi:hypothetical protein
MKNTPYPALLRTSYLSKEIKKIQKSCETIPLSELRIEVASSYVWTLGQAFR